MKKIILLLSLSFFATSANARVVEEIWLHLGMLSHHVSEKEYNEHHKLVGLEYGDWYVGYYDNSYNKDSYFVARNYTIRDLDKYIPRASLKAKVGFITGYSDVVAGTMPMIVPTLSFDFKPVSIDINILVEVYSVEFKFHLR